MRKESKSLLRFYGISFLLGGLVGLMACGLRFVISLLSSFHDYHFTIHSSLNLIWPIFITVVFVLFAWWVTNKFAKEASGSGVQEIEGFLIGVRQMNWQKLIPVKFLGACFTISSKMLLGREGPTIQIGGNLGGMFSDLFKQSSERRHMLVGAGAASGLAAAFNAPLAGVLFVLEEMHEHYKFSSTSFKSTMIACVMATMTLRFFYGAGSEIQMIQLAAPSLKSSLLFILFGLLLGFIGLGFNKLIILLLNKTAVLSKRLRIFYIVSCAFIVGGLSSHYSYLVGGGYEIIVDALNLSFSFFQLLMLFGTRFILTLVCYSTGIPGGIFAPVLALGTLLGILFGLIVVFFSSSPSLPFIDVFAVVGMGGLFAACIRAPITGIVLIVEMTQNYSLILSLMITCITSTMVVQVIKNPPLYYQLLQRLLKNEK